MREHCANCHLRLDRGENDHFLGAYVINFVGAELVIVGVMFVVAVLTWPDVPWSRIMWSLMALMVVFPLVTYPFSKTLWLAADLTLRPPTQQDFAR